VNGQRVGESAAPQVQRQQPTGGNDGD
jgi:hypothetical protein